MKKLVFWSLITLLTSAAWTQGNPVQISYPNCSIVSQSAGKDTLFGVPVNCNKTSLQGTHKVQTVCHYGDPSAARYEWVQAEVEVSVIPDSSGVLKDSLFSALEVAIKRQETYAASNGYAANVVPAFALFALGEENILAIPPINSGVGSYGIWYIGGVVYKIKLIRGDRLANLQIFLRYNFKLSHRNALLNPDSGKNAIDPLRAFLEQSR